MDSIHVNHSLRTCAIKPTHACVDSCVEPSGFARKIRAARVYMRAFMRPRIKACISGTFSVLSVINSHLCLSVFICGSGDS
jgi:hypothetical protein